jgi:hypothetical protein
VRGDSEFLKSLIALLAQHGGTFTCQLSELQQLGLELSLQNLSSDNAAMFTLRLGARIYYVPATTTAAQETTECPTPTNQPSPQPSHGPTISTENSPSPKPRQGNLRSVESELAAVSSLNNRPPQPSPTPSPDEEELTSLPSQQHRPVVRSDLDLYLLEQRQVTKRTAQATWQAQELRDATRQYPWETRKPS